MKHIIEDILDTAYENDLLEKSNLLSQSNKILRNSEDLSFACRFKSQGRKELITPGNKIVKTDDEISKSFGELLYNLVILAELNDLDFATLLRETHKNKK